MYMALPFRSAMYCITGMISCWHIVCLIYLDYPQCTYFFYLTTCYDEWLAPEIYSPITVCLSPLPHPASYPYTSDTLYDAHPHNVLLESYSSHWATLCFYRSISKNYPLNMNIIFHFIPPYCVPYALSSTVPYIYIYTYI